MQTPYYAVHECIAQAFTQAGYQVAVSAPMFVFEPLHLTIGAEIEELGGVLDSQTQSARLRNWNQLLRWPSSPEPMWLRNDERWY